MVSGKQIYMAITDLCKENEMSVSRLAQICGVSDRYIYNLKYRINVKIDIIIKVCAVFKIRVQDFFERAKKTK